MSSEFLTTLGIFVGIVAGTAVLAILLVLCQIGSEE
jgi:hypothetical protein